MDSSFLNPASALLALELMPGMSVADFDAGAGFFTRAAARLVAPGVVWAVEPRQDMLPHLKHMCLAEGLDHVEVVAGNIERPGGTHLPAGTFDAVIVANTLFACDNKAAVAAEAARLLKPGGQALIIDWEGSFGGLGPAPEQVVSREQALAACKAAGLLPIVREVAAGLYHWGCIVRKG